MTNCEPNKIIWSVGDLVIHDADAKTQKMLMRVVDTLEDGRIKTRYINTAGGKPYYLNSIEVLHDPAMFGIDTHSQSFTEEELNDQNFY